MSGQVGFGWLPDPVDYRDIVFSLADEHLPLDAPGDEASAEHLCAVEPLDQNGDNSCVVQAVAQAVRGAHAKAGHVDPPLLSRHALWWPCRKLAGAERKNEGTNNRQAFKVMNAVGFCKEEYWPHIVGGGEQAHLLKQPSTIALKMSYDQKLKPQHTVYRRLYEVGEERITRLKQCVANELLPVFGTDVSWDFAHAYFNPEVAIGPPNAEDVAGGHAMIIGAYRTNLGDTEFKIRTSWGAWQLNGWCWVNAAYVSRFRDIWVVEQAPWFTG